MGWDELAIVSSLVTGIATLGVAVFLSVQLRVQHKDSERLHLDSERQFAFLNENRQQELFISYYETESAANLFWKGASDFDSLTEAEENRYRMMMHSMYFHLVNAWKLERDGGDFRRLRASWEATLRHPGQRRMYEKTGRTLLARDPDITEFVEEIYSELESQAA